MLDDGGIAEAGSHDHLVGMRGRYARLVAGDDGALAAEMLD